MIPVRSRKIFNILIVPNGVSKIKVAIVINERTQVIVACIGYIFGSSLWTSQPFYIHEIWPYICFIKHEISCQRRKAREKAPILAIVGEKLKTLTNPCKICHTHASHCFIL